MKKIGDYTVRGQIPTSNGDTHRIILFDGRFDTAYKVVDFEISFMSRADSGSEIASAKLLTVDGDSMVGDNRQWNWDVNTEIAWASCAHDANGLSTQTIDRDWETV